MLRSSDAKYASAILTFASLRSCRSAGRGSVIMIPTGSFQDSNPFFKHPPDKIAPAFCRTLYGVCMDSNSTTFQALPCVLLVD